MNSNAPQFIRAFVAIDLPAEVRANLEQLQRELKSALPNESVRWTRPEQIHLTLKFLGQVASESLNDLQAAVKHACKPIAPFELRTEALDFFPSIQRPHVIWIGVQGALDVLQGLQELVERETASWREREQRAFEPHLTLARVKSLSPRATGALRERVGALTVSELGHWRVASVDLMQSKLASQGATHIRLATFELAS